MQKEKKLGHKIHKNQEEHREGSNRKPVAAVVLFSARSPSLEMCARSRSTEGVMNSNSLSLPPGLLYRSPPFI